MGWTEEQLLLLDQLNRVRGQLDKIAERVGPMKFNDEVRRWKLCSDADFGGVYCAQHDCGCAVEEIEIITATCGAEDDVFTVDDVYQAVAAHITRRRERTRATIQ